MYGVVSLIIIFINLLFGEFLTLALANGFPLESEWLQVFSSPQDSSQYSGWSQQYYTLDGLHTPLISKSSITCTNTYVTVPNATTTIGIIVTIMLYSFFSSQARSKYLCLFSLSFSSCSHPERQSLLLSFHSLESFFFPPALADGFHRSLSDSKSPQVSRNLVIILADLNNTVVRMVSTCPIISESFSPCINTLVTVPSAPFTIGITATFIFHSFFSSITRSMYLYIFLLSFSFVLSELQSPLFGSFSFFVWLSRRLVVWPRLDDPLYLKNHTEFKHQEFPVKVK